MTDPTLPFDEARFRQVLGHFTTGVTVVTAAGADGPVGLAVGSFASVSLDPPLVGLLPGHGLVVVAEDRSDRPLLRERARRGAGRRVPAVRGKGDDKFRGLGWRTAGSGAPILDGILAWIDCDIASVTDAGDHYFVLGRVRDLAVAHDGAPLLFFRGGYGRFAV